MINKIVQVTVSNSAVDNLKYYRVDVIERRNEVDVIERRNEEESEKNSERKGEYPYCHVISVIINDYLSS